MFISIQAEELEETRRTPKRTRWKCFKIKIAVTTLTVLLSVIVILLSTHIIPTWPYLPPRTNKINNSIESALHWEFCSPGGELDPWREASSQLLVSVLSLPSTALLLHFLLGPSPWRLSDADTFTPSTQKAKGGRSGIKASRSTYQVQATNLYQESTQNSMVTHACNPNTQKVGLLWVQGYPTLHIVKTRSNWS